METANVGADESTPKMFLSARFEIPRAHATGEDDRRVSGHATESTELSFDSVEQFFDTTNCTPAMMGLSHGTKPIKPEPGDYNYSGMHDQGPLPEPKEGGQFSQIIGLVNAAKKASDAYLTEVIEKEKGLAKAFTTDVAHDHEQKRKRR